MTEEKAKEVWTIDDLVALTETVQSAEVEYQGKLLPIQWCELTESEEPKMGVPDDDSSNEDVQEYYKEIAQVRVGKMISKANTMNPDNTTLTQESWVKLPTTIRWQVSGKILGGEASEDFING
tara:strand:- start:29 stop:397 length:369 start_codon:yes stop_codon:yes gene_type:complete